MQLIEISLKTEKGGEDISRQTGQLIPQFGLEGDFRGGDHPRMISLLADETRQAIGENPQIGLCSRRFSANLITRGLDTAALVPGQPLQIGSAVLEITQVGKKCFPDCPLVQSGSPCPLSRESVFARVAQGGKISVGDPLLLADK